MNIEVQVKDINGNEINLGDRVYAYAQNYAEISRSEPDEGGIQVVELDTSKPKPIQDVPLFVGVVAWSEDMLALEIVIEDILVEWGSSPSRIRMGGGCYVYEISTDH